MKSELIKNGRAQDSNILPRALGAGLVLMDMSFKLIAFDQGAANIINCTALRNRSDTPAQLPKELMDLISSRKPHELACAKMHLRIGANDYHCRTYIKDSDDGSPAMIGLHLERLSSIADAVRAVGEKCNLTGRELETLKGIAMGLHSKELAQMMNVSPNTVKVFLRLIMIKMGVTNRGGIVAQILQKLQDGPDASPARPVAGARANAAKRGSMF